MPWEFLAWLPVSFTLHEAAHALVAYESGDTSVAPRLTLNPLKHFSPIGGALLPLLSLGLSGGTWLFVAAKPVFFEPGRCRKPRVARILVALAGPLSNALLALAVAVVYRLVAGVPTIGDLVYRGVVVNALLAVFNLLPIPPLDGSHFWLSFIPERHEDLALNLQLGGVIGLAVCLFGLPLLGVNDPVSDFVLCIVRWMVEALT